MNGPIFFVIEIDAYKPGTISGGSPPDAPASLVASHETASAIQLDWSASVAPGGSAPTAPYGLTAGSETATSIAISWSPSSGS